MCCSHFYIFVNCINDLSMKELLHDIFGSSAFDTVILSNTLRSWLVALIIIIVSYGISKFARWFIKSVLLKLSKRTKFRFDDILFSTMEKPVAFAIVISGCRVAMAQLSFTQSIDSVIGKIFVVLATINGTWLIASLLSALIDEYIRPRVQQASSESVNQVFSMVRKIVVGIVWVFGVVTALNNSGYDVGALIAGLGIGGLAMAMAAQNTVANFFGGFTILLDKPFTIGQRIRISGYDGFVESIGMRTFRLRTLAGTLVTIPNSVITGTVIENITLEPTRKITLSLGLTYNTTPQQMEEAIATLKDIALSNPHVSNDTNVYFDSYGDFSLGLTFIYYIVKDADIFETQSEVNLEILRRFGERKLDFAFPTQTLILDKP